MAPREGCLTRHTEENTITAHVAVIDPVPAFRSGLARGLEVVGLVAELPDDILYWARRPSADAAVISLTSNRAKDDLERLCAGCPRLTIVALVECATLECYQQALDAGAGGVACRASSVEHIVDVVAAALAGLSLMPASIARALAAGYPRAEPLRHISAEELAWLRSLAAGKTVSDLATEVGYSRRTLHRLLRDTYIRLGVSGRSAAISTIARRGLAG